MVTDWGPHKWWLKVIWRTEDDKCSCGVSQNAVYLRRFPLIGDCKGRSLEEVWEYYQVVADFLA